MWFSDDLDIVYAGTSILKVREKSARCEKAAEFVIGLTEIYLADMFWKT